MQQRDAEPGRATAFSPGAELAGALARSVRALRFARRRLDAAKRALPDFLILGAQRAGTTSLYSYLLRHTRIAPAFTKEVHYFTLHRGEPEAWYRAHFPRVGTLSRRAALTGEATPYYLFHPHVARQVHALLPDARFVVLLRDPVARAWSHYQHERARGRETLEFAEALAREEERLAPEVARMAGDPSTVSPIHQHQSYFARGLYAEQLLRWWEHFPAERFLVLRSENFFANPAAGCAEVFDFLGLPREELGELRPVNPRRYASLDFAEAEALAERYAPHARALVELLGDRYSWPGA